MTAEPARSDPPLEVHIGDPDLNADGRLSGRWAATMTERRGASLAERLAPVLVHTLWTGGAAHQHARLRRGKTPETVAMLRLPTVAGENPAGGLQRPSPSLSDAG